MDSNYSKVDQSSLVMTLVVMKRDFQSSRTFERSPLVLNFLATEHYDLEVDFTIRGVFCYLASCDVRFCFVYGGQTR